ncbi:hypothetical protein GCK32_001739 [Trichostrongylus colubriformis]|uniref:G-protein coupled receptors family 1 profile domain-containing protein n=1 Tax=Trichostrongylus colubriformis TaxID=6319 RepID=A0AAN8FNL5_TRICO
MLSLMVVTFMFCWLPYHLYHTFELNVSLKLILTFSRLFSSVSYTTLPREYLDDEIRVMATNRNLRQRTASNL